MRPLPRDMCTSDLVAEIAAHQALVLLAAYALAMGPSEAEIARALSCRNELDRRVPQEPA